MRSEEATERGGQMKTAAEVRKGNRDRAKKHREKVRSQKVFEGLSDVKTLAQGADFMNRISRSAYCPLNGEPCDAQECCKKRREKRAETWKDAPRNVRLANVRP